MFEVRSNFISNCCLDGAALIYACMEENVGLL